MAEIFSSPFVEALSGVCCFGSWDLLLTTLYCSWDGPCWLPADRVGPRFTSHSYTWLFRPVFLWDRPCLLVTCIGISDLSGISNFSLYVSENWTFPFDCNT